MKQIKYKYSLKWDLIWMYRNMKNMRWLTEKRIVVFKPSIFKMVKLWFNMPVGPKIETELLVTCYWLSSGTWGSYIPPDKIFICPRGLKDVVRVINHEISHLKHDEEVQGMSHEEKENYINKVK